MPGIRTRLAECRARRMHVTDMPVEVQHLYWRDHAAANRALLADVLPFPSEYSDLIDGYQIEIEYANARRLEHIARRRMLRGYSHERAA